MLPTLDAVRSLQTALGRDLTAFVPELLLVGTIVLMLLARMSDRLRDVNLVPFAILMVAGAFGVLLTQPDGEAFTTFGGMLRHDDYAIYGRLFLLVFLLGSLVLSEFTGIPDREDSADYATMLLGATLGMMLMCSANHLLMVFLAIEMASVPSYAMAGFLKGKRTGSEAALKYVVYGASASGVMLYGISLITAKFGSGALADVALGYAASGIDLPLLAGTLFVAIGLAFKLSAVPFHFWCPDVFHGAAAEVGAFLSVASKGAAVLLAGRLLLTVPLPVEAGVVIAVCAAFTMTLGNLAAFGQTNLKRLLAYSTIAHAGYLLMALSTLRPDGVAAALFYMAAYLLMNLGAFAVVALVRNATGSEHVDALRGLFARSPGLAVALTLFLMSLLGLPPLAGFAAKFQIFASVYDAGRISDVYYVLLVVGALNTVFSLGYYLRLIRLMALEPSTDPEPLKLPPFATGYIAAMAMLLVAVGLFWNPLSTAGERAVAAAQEVAK